MITKLTPEALNFLEQLKSKEITLSFTSLKELLESPNHFLTYKLGEKKTTDAMTLGSLTHCLILEPDEFKNRYLVFEKPVPTSNMAKTENKEAYTALVLQAEKESKEVIKIDQVEQAQLYANLIFSNPTAGEILAGASKKEWHINFNVDEWKVRGYVDATGYYEGQPMIADIKKLPDSNERKAYWEIHRRQLAMQAYIYSFGINDNPELATSTPYYILGVADNGVIVFRLMPQTLAGGKVSFDKAMNALQELIFLQDSQPEIWLSGREFYAENRKYYLL